VYGLSPNWGIFVMSGYDRLLGDAADSPLTEDRDQFRTGLGLAYTFH